MWDNMGVFLDYFENHIEVVVTYTHSGSGGTRERGFRFWFDVASETKQICLLKGLAYRGTPESYPFDKLRFGPKKCR